MRIGLDDVYDRRAAGGRKKRKEKGRTSAMVWIILRQHRGADLPKNRRPSPKKKGEEKRESKTEQGRASANAMGGVSLSLPGRRGEKKENCAFLTNLCQERGRRKKKKKGSHVYVS